MKVFIVVAHPEAQSFSHALRHRSQEALLASGHEVRVSGLHAMAFNPVASAADFTERRFPEALQYDREQKFASEHDAFAADILWWFSVPAIMKGWIALAYAGLEVLPPFVAWSIHYASDEQR